jgi:hypothetical protein
MDFLVAPTPSTYQTGRGILFSERHLKELEQRRIRCQINKVLMAIQTDPAFDSHADHFEFLYREYSISQTPERRASVKAQVDHYIRILAEHQTAGAPEPRVSTPPPSPTSLSAPERCVARSEPAFADPETIYQTPERLQAQPLQPPPAPPRLKKAGNLPLSPPPTPIMSALNSIIRSKSGNLPPQEFENSLEYLVYLIEMSATPQKKLEAYMEFYEFLMTQPTNMLRCAELRNTTSHHLVEMINDLATNHEPLLHLQQRYTEFLNTLRVHPYYVA